MNIKIYNLHIIKNEIFTPNISLTLQINHYLMMIGTLSMLVFQRDSKVEPVMENGNSYPEIKTISTENGSQVRTEDKDVVVEGFGSVGVYDQWIAPPVSGQRPRPRYEVLT